MIYKRTNINPNKLACEVAEANELDKGVQAPYFYEYDFTDYEYDFCDDDFYDKLRF